jgi:hypothetical protein
MNTEIALTEGQEILSFVDFIHAADVVATEPNLDARIHLRTFGALRLVSVGERDGQAYVRTAVVEPHWIRFREVGRMVDASLTGGGEVDFSELA